MAFTCFMTRAHNHQLPRQKNQFPSLQTADAWRKGMEGFDGVEVPTGAVLPLLLHGSVGKVPEQQRLDILSRQEIRNV